MPGGVRHKTVEGVVGVQPELVVLGVTHQGHMVPETVVQYGVAHDVDEVSADILNHSLQTPVAATDRQPPLRGLGVGGALGHDRAQISEHGVRGSDQRLEGEAIVRGELAEIQPHRVRYLTVAQDGFRLEMNRIGRGFGEVQCAGALRTFDHAGEPARVDPVAGRSGGVGIAPMKARIGQALAFGQYRARGVFLEIPRG